MISDQNVTFGHGKEVSFRETNYFFPGKKVKLVLLVQVVTKKYTVVHHYLAFAFLLFQLC
jgi:hypothetical protein